MSPRALTVIRIFLAVVFASYGGVKLAGGQFYYGDWTMSRATVDGPSFVWAFYGFSPAYGRFIGLVEFIPALLLLVRRTSLVGAMALFPVALNITVMDFLYGFPSVKWMVLLYTALLGVLLYADRDRLFALLSAPPAAAVAARGAWHPAARRTLLGALVLFLAFTANLIATSLSDGPEEPARRALVSGGWPADSLQLKRSRYQGLFGINRTAVVEFSLGGDTTRRVIVAARKSTGFAPWVIAPVPSADRRH